MKSINASISASIHTLEIQITEGGSCKTVQPYLKLTGNSSKRIINPNAYSGDKYDNLTSFDEKKAACEAILKNNATGEMKITRADFKFDCPFDGDGGNYFDALPVNRVLIEAIDSIINPNRPNVLDESGREYKTLKRNCFDAVFYNKRAQDEKYRTEWRLELRFIGHSFEQGKLTEQKNGLLLEDVPKWADGL